MKKISLFLILLMVSACQRTSDENVNCNALPTNVVDSYNAAGLVVTGSFEKYIISHDISSTNIDQKTGKLSGTQSTSHDYLFKAVSILKGKINKSEITVSISDAFAQPDSFSKKDEKWLLFIKQIQGGHYVLNFPVSGKYQKCIERHKL